jgi:hypothetical protein
VNVLLICHGLSGNNLNSLISQTDQIVFTHGENNRKSFQNFQKQFFPTEPDTEIWGRFMNMPFGNYLVCNMKNQKFEIVSLENKVLFTSDSCDSHSSNSLVLRDLVKRFLTGQQNAAGCLSLFDYIFHFISNSKVDSKLILRLGSSRCNLLDFLVFASTTDTNPSQNAIEIFSEIQNHVTIPFYMIKNSKIAAPPKKKERKPT